MRMAGFPVPSSLSYWWRGADPGGAAQAGVITRTRPDGLHGTLCGIPALTGPAPGCPGG